MDIDTYFVQEEFHEVVKVPPAFVGKNLAVKVLEILKATYEDRCSKYGFVRLGSVSIRRIGAGQVELHSLQGYVNVAVIFTAQALNPPEKSFLKTQVKNINKFGILTSVQLDGKDVMQIIIPKQIALVKSAVNLDRIHIGERITVEVVKRRIEIGENVLYGIGRVVVDETHADVDASEPDDEFGAAPAVVKPEEPDELLITVEDSDYDEEEAPAEDETLGIIDSDTDGSSEIFSISDEDADVDSTL